MSITVGKKKLKNGRFSLFFDISMNGQRRKEYLKIKLEKATTNEVRQQNKMRLQFVEQLRLQREKELWGNDKAECHGITNPPIDFFDIYQQFQDSYHRKDYKIVHACGDYLHRFVKRNTLQLQLVNKRFCEGFLAFLFTHLHGNTPVGYFKKFKMCLEQCVEDGLLPSNPARKIRLTCSEEVTKDILDTAEIQLLANTPLAHTEVKRAFLFACYTGLRWCDIKSLRYKAIDFQRNLITIRQQKVMSHSSKSVLHLNMSQTTVGLLQMHSGTPDDLVFDLPSYSYTRRLLLAWTEQAGIKKHITFHCARHSFITNIMIGGANIKTASSLAGHSTIRHTEKYVHVIDDLKQKAVDSLPEIKLKEIL